MRGEEFRRNTFFGRLPSDRLGTVLAELEGRGMLLVRPGATRAIETIGLVRPQEEERRFGQTHLLCDRLGSGFQSAPAAGWCVVAVDTGNIALCHSIAPFLDGWGPLRCRKPSFPFGKSNERDSAVIDVG